MYFNVIQSFNPLKIEKVKNIRIIWKFKHYANLVLGLIFQNKVAKITFLEKIF